jgi:hypothetical protein
MGGMADFGAAAKMAGKDLNTEQLAEGTEKYLRMQRELTKLTGVEAKDAKAKAEALKSDIAYRRMLQEVGGDNAATLEKMLSQVNESYQPLVKTLLSGGQITDQNMALLQQALGDEFVGKIRGIGEQMRSGVTLDPDVVTAEFKDSLLKATDSMNAYLSQYSAATLQTVINKGGPFAGFLEAFGPVYKDITASTEAAGSVTDNVNAVANGVGQIAKTLPEIEKASLQLRSIMYTIGASMLAVLAPAIQGLATFTDEKGGQFQSAIGGFTNSINEVQNILAKPIDPYGERGGFKSEQERMDALNKTLGTTLGGFLGGAGGGGLYERAFSGMQNVLTKFTDDFMFKFDRLLGEILPFYESDFEKIQDIIEKTKNIAEGRTISGTPTYTDTEAYGAGEFYTGPMQTNTDETALFDKLNSLSPAELATVGFMRDGDTFKKIPKPSEAQTTARPGHMAMGGMFDYRPGGKIITIAEAGPELVAPAKRGADGKLGLEVSGVMLDNSRLLQSLAETSKNQINVMAAVNNKMSEMVSGMEKFARAQEQANRLAV